MGQMRFQRSFLSTAQNWLMFILVSCYIIVSDNLLFCNQPKFTITTFFLMLKSFVRLNVSGHKHLSSYIRLVSQDFFPPATQAKMQADICYCYGMGGEHMKNKCGFFRVFFSLQQEMPHWLKAARPHEKELLTGTWVEI